VAVLVGEAVLSESVLVDSLVPEVIDGLREDLHPDFGVRAYRVYRVIRTWSGKRAGDGVSSDLVGELRPQPLVKVWTGLRLELASCGVDQLGEIALTEVSLTYTETQLTGGGGLTMQQELFYGITDAHGQGTIRKLFAITRPPYIDRIKDMGWVVWLRSVKGDPGGPWEP
jgi:hypothetical protein